MAMRQHAQLSPKAFNFVRRIWNEDKWSYAPEHKLMDYVPVHDEADCDRFRTMFHTLMDLEDSMQKMSEYHSPEDRAKMLATNARVYAQVTTFMLDFTLMVSGIAGVVGVVEGLIRGNMPVGSFAGIVLTVCLILNFLAAILLSIFSIYIDNRPEGTDRKQLRVHYDRERPPPNS